MKSLYVGERIVCARRARKLRKRGEHIEHVGFSPRGKARFSWWPGLARVWAVRVPL